MALNGELPMKNRKHDGLGILKEHIKTYPHMEVRDACKLIYQSIFGGGHMIPDPSYSLKRLQDEFLEYNSMEGETLEYIGKGTCRIYLNVVKAGLSLETLNQMFVISANHKKGTIETLEEYLEELLKQCENRVLPFEYEECKRFVEIWKKQGYPAISHSETYRFHYKPAYRVVDEAYVKYYPVFCEIDRLLAKEKDNNRPVIVCIDGMAGSGKSTLGHCFRRFINAICSIWMTFSFNPIKEQRNVWRNRAVMWIIDVLKKKYTIR